MNIVDAIGTARNEAQLYFLLTAYIEAAGYEDRGGKLPSCMRALPLHGRADVSARLEYLNAMLGEITDTGDRKEARVRDAVRMFEVALHRLHSLDAARETAAA
jgi:hypothetical protein